MNYRRKFFVIAIALSLFVGILWRYLGRTDEQSYMTAAYSDGFEVIVLGKQSNGEIRNANSLSLAEGESLVASDRNTTFLLPLDTKIIQEHLRANESERTDLQVQVIVIGAEAGPQEIEVAYSYGNRSFSYAYRTDGKRIWPTWSGGADLSGRRRVTYVQRHD